MILLIAFSDSEINSPMFMESPFPEVIFICVMIFFLGLTCQVIILGLLHENLAKQAWTVNLKPEGSEIDKTQD